MVNPLIRPAEVRDARALAELWLEIGKHLAALNPHAFKLPEATGLAEWFAGSLTTASNEDSTTFVAEVGHEVAGTIYVRLIPPMETASRQVLRDVGLLRAEIDALAVAERFRRRGIGRQLMSEAERWGRQKGAGLFFLDTYIASPLSVPFYERIGYARRSVRFVKPPEYGAAGQ
jgi:GNAT superfamily N-acetyltransferase